MMCSNRLTGSTEGVSTRSVIRQPLELWQLRRGESGFLQTTFYFRTHPSLISIPAALPAVADETVARWDVSTRSGTEESADVFVKTSVKPESGKRSAV